MRLFIFYIYLLFFFIVFICIVFCIFLFCIISSFNFITFIYNSRPFVFCKLYLHSLFLIGIPPPLRPTAPVDEEATPFASYSTLVYLTNATEAPRARWGRMLPRIAQVFRNLTMYLRCIIFYDFFYFFIHFSKSSNFVSFSFTYFYNVSSMYYFFISFNFLIFFPCALIKI